VLLTLWPGSLQPKACFCLHRSLLTVGMNLTVQRVRRWVKTTHTGRRGNPSPHFPTLSQMLCPARGGSGGGQAPAAGTPPALRRRWRDPTAAWWSFPSLCCLSSEHQLSTAVARVGIHGRQPTGDGVHHTLLRACPCLFPFLHSGGDF
jgi:hypothetical protein